MLVERRAEHRRLGLVGNEKSNALHDLDVLYKPTCFIWTESDPTLPSIVESHGTILHGTVGYSTGCSTFNKHVSTVPG
jgi:hypothetical protein